MSIRSASGYLGGERSYVSTSRATVPISSGSIRGSVRPLSPTRTTLAVQSSGIVHDNEYAITKYSGPIRHAESDYGSSWFGNPWDYQLVTYSDRHTFSHDFWHEVLRPVGLGVAAPIAGAGAFVGSLVCGTGALVAGCAFGVVSTVRGAFGLLPVSTDYVLRPVANGIDYTASGMDHAVDKAVGAKEEAYSSGYSDWFGWGSNEPHYVAPKAIANDEWNLRRPVGGYSSGSYASREIIRPASSTNIKIDYL